MLDSSCATSAKEEFDGGSVFIVDKQGASLSTDIADKELLCPVCLEILKDPFLTACGHSFCYGCIRMHLNRRNDCPSCFQHLSNAMIYPNILLDKVLRKLATLQALDRASPAEQLQIFFQNGHELPINDIDELLDVLTEKRIKAKNQEDDDNMELLFQFLQFWHERKQKNLAQVRSDSRCLERDLNNLREEHKKLSATKRLYLSTFSWKRHVTTSKCTTDASTSQNYQSPARKKRQVINNEYEAVRDCYLRHRRDTEKSGLASFQSALHGFTRYSKARVLGEVQTGRAYSPNIISSIEFDKDDEFFATAGVSGSLKIFSYATVGNNTWKKPAVDIKTRSKLSCISWDNYANSLVASSDYDGVIKIWDISSCRCIAEFEEHEKRAWSVDFSPKEPSMVLSGSDDGKVKVWCKGHRTSVTTIEVKANICSVKYNPCSDNLIAAGSADHCIYYYDLRHTASPVHVFSEHQKAVSYIKFMSSNEMVSASTDGTLRLWSLDQKCKVETFRGHTNERNFVGLAVNHEYIACGSESNEVFVYYKGISRPAVCHKYPIDVEAVDIPFISAICWKREGFVLLAANSQGTIRALMLVP